MNNKQLINYFIVNEINNKNLTNLTKNHKADFTLVNSFQFTDSKLIKRVIAYELISGVRPSIKGVYKKRMILEVKTNFNLELFSFLQKAPIAWSIYLKNRMNLTDYFHPTPLISVPLVVMNSKFSLAKLLIKSVYLD